MVCDNSNTKLFRIRSSQLNQRTIYVNIYYVTMSFSELLLLSGVWNCRLMLRVAILARLLFNTTLLLLINTHLVVERIQTMRTRHDLENYLFALDRISAVAISKATGLHAPTSLDPPNVFSPLDI